MLLFGIFEDERVTIDVSPGMTVKEYKKLIQGKLNISDDLCKFDKTVISLRYARAELHDTWVLSDLGIMPGTTIRIQLKEEDNPVLYIRCSHNNETLTIFDNLNVGSMHVKDLRSMVSKRTGLPVGIFRLCTTSGQELYDCHTLDNYNIEAGHALRLENWDGLNELLNLASRGFTPQVISQISTDDIHGRYLVKVALYVASHFGNVDLARALLKLGGRCDEPIRDPPQRRWCNSLAHVDSFKASVHVATEMGQLGVLRLFVNHDITCLMAKNGIGLMPMNIALRGKVKDCASFILTKQWSRVNITKTATVSLKLFSKIKYWCEKAKESTYLKYGLTKSSIKKRNIDFGPLVSYGVIVDGFSKSTMNGKSKIQLLREEKEKRKVKENVLSMADSNFEDPEHYFKNLNIAVTDRPSDRRVHIISNMKTEFPKQSFQIAQSEVKQAWRETRRTDGRGTPSRSSHSSSPDHSKKDTESLSPDRDRGIKLPPILERNRRRPMSQSQPALNISPKGSVKLGKGGIKKLTNNNKKAFSRNAKRNKNITQSLPNVNILPTEITSSIPNIGIPASDRSEKSKYLGTSLGSYSSIAEEPELSEDAIDHEPKRGIHTHRKKKKTKILRAKPNTSDALIPLPLISNEQSSRPFFYHNGLREEDMVEPTVELLTKYKGGSPRERAINSLVIASSFKEKPWLTQVRMALNLSTNAMKRNVKLKSTRKETGVQCALTPVHPVSSRV